MGELIGVIILGLVVAAIIGFMADYAISIILQEVEDEEKDIDIDDVEFWADFERRA